MNQSKQHSTNSAHLWQSEDPLNCALRPLSLIFLLLSAACTTWQPSAAAPAELQRLILAEGLLAPGDTVKITTALDTVQLHKFRVEKLDLESGLVTGAGNVIRIDDIVSIQTRSLSWLRTGLLIGGLVLATTGTECTDECNGFGGGSAFACC